MCACACGGEKWNGGKSAAEGGGGGVARGEGDCSTVLARISVGQQCGHAAS